MVINPNHFIGDVPVLDVRSFFRKYCDGFKTEAIQNIFGIDIGNNLLNQLITIGYIEQNNNDFKLTVSGSRFVCSKAREFTRKAADKALTDFLFRCSQLETNKDFLYKVKKALLFGSMLTDKQKVGDVDIAIELVYKDQTITGKDWIDL